MWALDSPIRPSRRLWGLTLVAHAVALGAVACAWLPLWAQVLAALAVLLGLWPAWRRVHLVRADSIVRLCVDDRHWVIVLGNGQRLRVRPAAWAVWRELVVIDFRTLELSGRYRLVVLRDSLEAADYRRLQARLRLAGDADRLRLDSGLL